MNILLVEDDQFTRTLTGHQLKEAGFKVTAVADAAAALAALEQGGFDLLITDIVLPQTDGGQLMKTIRQQGLDIPIIAITGGVENAQDDYSNYADMFADRTLVKPIKKDELIALARELAGS